MLARRKNDRLTGRTDFIECTSKVSFELLVHDVRIEQTLAIEMAFSMNVTPVYWLLCNHQ